MARNKEHKYFNNIILRANYYESLIKYKFIKILQINHPEHEQNLQLIFNILFLPLIGKLLKYCIYNSINPVIRLKPALIPVLN